MTLKNSYFLQLWKIVLLIIIYYLFDGGLFAAGDPVRYF